MFETTDVLCCLNASVPNIITYQAYAAYSKDELNKNGISSAKNRKCTVQWLDMIYFICEGY